ncbi:hypothetical protein niasHT_008222 [Heterodera trifolii]|uniref:Uncharacterized protein n=1 Tax=Heterodera trifolii TaxID=157864 RepID=A0ABD2LUF6_9BILA
MLKKFGSSSSTTAGGGELRSKNGHSNCSHKCSYCMPNNDNGGFFLPYPSGMGDRRIAHTSERTTALSSPRRRWR